MDKADIKSFTLEELQEQIVKIGEKSFRAKQVYDWLHVKLSDSFLQMTNLSKGFREKLEENFKVTSLETVDVLKSNIDGSMKFLLKLEDSNIIESVFMRYKHGNSVCISSQAGCRMGCKFCASTLLGLARNLTPSEMLDQIYKIKQYTNERISNIVIMGVGEPLDNYDSLIKFITILTGKDGLNISQRNITISTCGLVPQIKKLATKKLQVTLALSLHAPNDIIRKSLMPIANTYTIRETIEACKEYFEMTNRRLTFEYSLIEGINDRSEDATELARLLKNINCHVNLINVNPVKERVFKQSKVFSIQNFKNILEKSQISVTIRREIGKDIEAACGQLRKGYIESEPQFIQTMEEKG